MSVITPASSFIAPTMFDAAPIERWPFDGLMPQAYSFIMLDPPWRFRNWSPAGEEKGPEPHYKTMTDDEICALPVWDLSREDCLVWCWATWPKLDTAMRALGAWGFEYVTGGAWNKRKWGTGYVWRSVCEPVLIAKRGEPKARGRAIPNLFDEPRREHSRKPDCAYVLAERMMPGARRADLFSRATRPGWESWGYEKGKFDDQ